jgi:hypothetical protein
MHGYAVPVMAETAYRLSLYGGLLRARAISDSARDPLANGPFRNKGGACRSAPRIASLYAGTHTVASKNKIPPISQAKADATSAVLDR